MTNSSATGVIPPLIHAATQSQYSLTEPFTLTRKHYKILSDNPAIHSRAFDNVHGTIYSSQNPTCSLGIDVGTDVLLNLTKVRFFPNSRWFIAA